MLAAARAGLRREPAPRVDRQARKARTKALVTNERAQSLVGAIIHAESVTVAEYQPLARKRRDRRIVQQGRAGFGAETFADHEVAIAAHDIDERSAGRHGGDRPDYFAVRRFGIVVADPGLEEISQEEQGARAAYGTGQESLEPGRDFRRRWIEVKVGGEPGGHFVSSAFVSFGG